MYGLGHCDLLNNFLGQSSLLHVLSMWDGVADISNNLYIGVNFMTNGEPW
jgi:hypothetical protein